MMRSMLAGSILIFLSLNLIMADTVKTKIKSIDEEKRTITVEVDAKDVTYNLTKEAKIYTTGKAKKGQPAPEIIITLAAVNGKDATVTTDKVDGKDVVTIIKIEPATKKKKGTN